MSVTFKDAPRRPRGAPEVREFACAVHVPRLQRHAGRVACCVRLPIALQLYLASSCSENTETTRYRRRKPASTIRLQCRSLQLQVGSLARRDHYRHMVLSASYKSLHAGEAQNRLISPQQLAIAVYLNCIEQIDPSLKDPPPLDSSYAGIRLKESIACPLGIMPRVTCFAAEISSGVAADHGSGAVIGETPRSPVPNT